MLAKRLFFCDNYTMNSIRKHIDSLTPREVLSLIEDYETFERVGSIGDCALRRTAQSLTPPGCSIVSMMRDVAFEAYRTVARSYLEAIQDEDHD